MSPTLPRFRPAPITPTNDPTAVMAAEDSCGCADNQLARRRFLQGLGLAGLAGVVSVAGGTIASRAAYAADPSYSGPVLVMISLRGGFDGLSAICPIGDPDYAKVRPNIAVPASTAVNIDDRTFGLHPSLAPLLPLWKAGTMAAVQAVGTPDQTRSHFSATQTLEDAAPGTTIRTGWLDRVLATAGTGTVFEAVQLGSGSTPGLLGGPAPSLSASSLKNYQLGWDDAVRKNGLSKALRTLHADPSFPGSAAANLTLDALNRVESTVAADPGPRNQAQYPKSPLGAALKDAAILLRSNVGVQALTMDVGNWDMHSGLGNAGGGWMAKNLSDVATSLAAFAQDLGDTLLRRVTIMTVSEFGRRVAENGSGGLDHGHGNAMMLLGGGLSGGRVFGSRPTLAAGALDHGDLAGTTDYRNVLAEYLTKRAGMNTGQLSSVFPGLTVSPVGAFA